MTVSTSTPSACVSLTQAVLDKPQGLSNHIALPTYDRRSLTAGIVHFGVGGFHRAHQAMYLDQLMNQGEAHDWGIVGVGAMPCDRRMQEALAAQDYLFTLMVKHSDGRIDARVIGSMIDYLFAPDDPEAVIERLCDPAIRIVSLTVTEGGYNFHQITGDYDVDAPAVVHDLANPTRPQTTFGLVIEALVRRRQRGIAPFTIMSCDNIQGNGDVASRMFVAHARALDAQRTADSNAGAGGLGDWIASHVSFPNSMVDRITPVTTQEDIALLESSFGLTDRWPVTCEPFTQWVLEDHFGRTAGGEERGEAERRPAFEKVGVQLVDDVVPYELMKLRLLNASHQALTYLGYLAGFRYAHEVCQDPLFIDFLLAYMDREATPTLSPLPGVDLAAYKRTLIERFANPNIRDTLARLCAESSDRIPKWLVPVVHQQLAAEGDVRLCAAIIASWARYAEGIDEQGEAIAVVDRLSERLTRIALTQKAHPLAFLEQQDLFGDLATVPCFADAYVAVLNDLHQLGARVALERLMASLDASR